MTDTKEKDETGPRVLPVPTAEGLTEPASQTEQLNGEGSAADGSDPSVVVKQDDGSNISESGSGVPMESTEAKVSPAGVAEDNKVGTEAETKVSPADVAETKVSPADVAEAKVSPADVAETKVSPADVAETKISPADVAETKISPVNVAETKISPADVDDVNVVATDAEAKVDDKKVGAEAENKAPAEAVGDEKVGNGSTDNSHGSVVDDTVEKQAETESLAKALSGDGALAVKSIPDGTVAKDDAVVSETETPVKPDEPASDTVAPASEMHVETAEASEDVKTDALPISEIKADANIEMVPAVRNEHSVVNAGTAEVKAGSEELGEDTKDQVTATGEKLETDDHGMIMSTPVDNGKSLASVSFLLDDDDDSSDTGTGMEQAAFMKELENFFRERSMEFKPPKFYGEGLNLLKLWRAVMRLGGYDKVTSCKLWRQVGESFRPPKTCTTVSWTFRGFYEKALLDYERHKVSGGEVTLPIASQSEPGIEQQGSGSGRARRDAAARAMQGWHSQRLLGNGEVSDPIIKDKTPVSLQKRDKQLRNTGLLKRKKPSYVDSAVKVPRTQASKSQLDIAVVDLGLPADWVKINVQRTKDCFEIYALVPGLLREEVRVQSDPAGRLVISGEPEHPDNPWGVTPFKKVITLPSRIDPHQTSAVVTLHGQLFIRVPFEQSE